MRARSRTIAVVWLAACGAASHDQPDAAPSARLHIRWSCVDGTGATIACSTVAAEILVTLSTPLGDTTHGMPSRVTEIDSPSYPLLTTVHVRIYLLGPDTDVIANAIAPSVVLLDHAGVTEADPLKIEVFDEPAPQLQAILAGAEAAWPSPSTATSQFPPSQSSTPDIGACCPDPCTPDPTIYMTPTWQTLGFTQSSRYRWSYEFDSQGAGPSATFQIHAWADLDCDAVYSHWEIDGSVDSSGNVVAGSIQKLVHGE